MRSFLWAVLKIGRKLVGRWLETPPGAHRGLEQLARARHEVERADQVEAIGAHLRSSFQLNLGAAEVKWVIDLATFFADSFCQHCGTSPDHVHGRCPECAANLTKKLAERRALETTKPEGT